MVEPVDPFAAARGPSVRGWRTPPPRGRARAHGGGSPSVLKRPMAVSAGAVSWLSPIEPTQGSRPASAKRPGRAGWRHAAIRGPSARRARRPGPDGAGGWPAPGHRARTPHERCATRARRRSAARRRRRASLVRHRAVDEAGPGRDTREIGPPEPVRRGCPELAVHELQGARCGTVRRGAARCGAVRRGAARCGAVAEGAPRRLGPHRALQPHGAHPARHRAPRHDDPLAAQRAPDPGSGSGAGPSGRRESPKFSACTRAISGRSPASRRARMHARAGSRRRATGAWWACGAIGRTRQTCAPT